MMLLKEKSREGEGLIKVRLIMSHFHHPSPHEGSVVGWCLSLVSESFSELSSNLEVWNMQESKQRFTHACDLAANDPMEWCGAELDMVNIYTEIPSPHVRDAVVYALSKVQEGRWSRRPISWFAFSKNAKVEDCLGSAASAYFVNIPMHIALDNIDYELSRNGLFRVGAWVLNQVRGLPMGRLSLPCLPPCVIKVSPAAGVYVVMQWDQEGCMVLTPFVLTQQA